MQTEKNQIFSQEALDKLRSPEKLDTMLSITTPITWMALCAILVLLFSVVLWSILGSFTIKAEGMGLIMDSAGVELIESSANGKIAHLYIKAGIAVKKGDIIAQIQEQTVMKNIYSNYDGIIEEVMVDEDSAIPFGTPLCSVRIKQERDDLTGLLYIPLDKGKSVQTGMWMQLEPNGVDVSKSGSLLGVVRLVSQYPMTLQEMQEHLGNAQLAQWILQANASPVMEVTFDLIRDPDSDSGYLWTSKVAEHKPITPGSFCTGSIIVERKPPIEKIFYKFSQWLRSN